MEYYTSLGPGAGFFPLWLGVVMGGLSLAWFVQISPSQRAAERGRLSPRPPGHRPASCRSSAPWWRRRLLMDFLGYQVAMFLLLFFLLLVPGRQTIWLTLVIALLGSVGVYHVFGSYLDVQLPKASLALLAGLGPLGGNDMEALQNLLMALPLL